MQGPQDIAGLGQIYKHEVGVVLGGSERSFVEARREA